MITVNVLFMFMIIQFLTTTILTTIAIPPISIILAEVGVVGEISIIGTIGATMLLQ